MKKRINYIDIVKALAIILVIIGHINYIGFNHDIKVWIYSFHIPIFFFVTGHLYSIKNSNLENNDFKIKEYFLKKIKSLYIPYLLWGLIYAELTPSNLVYLLWGSHFTLKHINSTLWFLPCYFISMTLFDILMKIINIILKSNKSKICFITSLIIVFSFSSINLPILNICSGGGYPLSFNVSLIGLAFMFLGYLLTFIVNYLKKAKTRSLVIIFLILFALTLLHKFNSSIDYVLMAENIYGNFLIFFVTATCGILMIFSLAFIIERTFNNKLIKFLCYIGKNTLVIFAIQAPVLSLMTKLLNNIAFPNSVIIIIYLLVILAFSCIFIEICNKFIPQLNGKFN